MTTPRARTLILLSAAMLWIAPASADASTITIDFGGLLGPNGSAFPNPYTEDGFTVTPTVGTLQQGTIFGNPEPSLIVGPVSAPVDGTFEITAGGGLFSWVSYDYSNNNGSAFHEIQGYLNNVNVFTQPLDLSASPGFAFATITSLVGGLSIDRLTFVVNPSADASSVNLDNIVLETAAAPVPEPASLTLLGLGLAGMAGRRWRQRKRA